MERNGPLSGVRVVEMANYIAGPFASQLLADLGADVVKIETPSGDPFRYFGDSAYSAQYVAFNRNKRSVVLDLLHASQAQTAQQLVADADVFIENSRPGVMIRWGLGYDQIHALNPETIYCSISGHGQDGPHAANATFDTVAQATGGMLSQLLQPDAPQIVGPAFSDNLAGMTAAYSVLAALYSRHRGEGGQHLDVSMLGATVGFLSLESALWLNGGRVSEPTSRPSASQSYAFTCEDGRILVTHLSSPEKFWTGLVAAIGRPEFLSDPRFGSRRDRVKNFGVLQEALRPIFARKTSTQWSTVLTEHDVAHAVVNDIPAVFDHPQVKHLGLETVLEHPTEGTVRTAGPPVRFADDPRPSFTPPPLLGEHTETVLAELATRLDAATVNQTLEGSE